MRPWLLYISALPSLAQLGAWRDSTERYTIVRSPLATSRISRLLPIKSRYGTNPSGAGAVLRTSRNRAPPRGEPGARRPRRDRLPPRPRRQGPAPPAPPPPPPAVRRFHPQKDPGAGGGGGGGGGGGERAPEGLQQRATR